MFPKTESLTQKRIERNSADVSEGRTECQPCAGLESK